MTAHGSRALTRASKLPVRISKYHVKRKKAEKTKIILCIKWLELQCLAVCFLLSILCSKEGFFSGLPDGLPVE